MPTSKPLLRHASAKSSAHVGGSIAANTLAKSWYALTEEEKMGQMGLSESETLRADGVLYSAFNSFYFDTYRFGFFYFDLAGEKEINEILTDSGFISYCQEVIKRGPDSSFHEVCDEKCAFRRCSKMLYFPASISRW